MSILPPRLLGDDPLLRCVGWRCAECGKVEENPAATTNPATWQFEGADPAHAIAPRSAWHGRTWGHDNCPGQLLFDLEPVGLNQAVAQAYDDAVNADPQWDAEHTSGTKGHTAVSLQRLKHMDPEQYERVLAKIEAHMDGDPLAASLARRRRHIDAENER